MAKNKQLRHEDSSETCLASSMSPCPITQTSCLWESVPEGCAPLWYVLARQQLICYLAIASCHLIHLQSTVSRVRTVCLSTISCLKKKMSVEILGAFVGNLINYRLLQNF